MDSLLNEVCNPETLQQVEAKYKQEAALGQVSSETSFEYVMLLIRSRYQQDWENGLQLLKQLYYETKDEQLKRDYTYFTAFTYCKLNEFDEAVRCCEAFLTVEPGNRQIAQLKQHAEELKKQKMYREAATVGGTGLALGLGIAAGAMLLSKALKK